MTTIPKLPPEWYHRRLQAVGRAQSRYLTLLLVVSAYTFGLHFTAVPTVSVTFLGLLHVREPIVNAASMIVLGVLLLALFGTLQAARVAFNDLVARLAMDGIAEPNMAQVDEHPNVADLLSYAGYLDGKPRRWTRVGVLVLYPVPVLAAVLWMLVLWWWGVNAEDDPVWVSDVYLVAGTLLVILVLLATAAFVRRSVELFRTGK